MFFPMFIFPSTQNQGGNKSERQKLQEAFYNFDEEKQGYLSIDDLRYIVTTDGNPLAGQDLEEFLKEVRTAAHTRMCNIWTKPRFLNIPYCFVLILSSARETVLLALTSFSLQADIYNNGVIDYKAFCTISFHSFSCFRKFTLVSPQPSFC